MEKNKQISKISRLRDFETLKSWSQIFALINFRII